MILFGILAFILLALLVWAWVTGISYMHEKHPDYKGEDWLNWDEDDRKTIL